MGDDSAAPPVKRTSKGQFPPGVSGNPGGPPRVTTTQAQLKELARTHHETAIATLAELCVSADRDAVRCAAAVALLDRGFGRPAQAIELSEAGGDPLGLAEVRAAAREYLSDPSARAQIRAAARITTGTDEN